MQTEDSLFAVIYSYQVLVTRLTSAPSRLLVSILSYS